MFNFLFILTFIICLGDCLKASRFRLSFKSQRTDLNRYVGKTITVLEYLFTFLLIVANRTGVDIINYRNTYYRKTEFSYLREPFYTFLRILSRNNGLNFYVFRAILTFAAALLPIWLINKLEVKHSFVLAFYLPSLLFLDSMQFRNAIALCIITWATYFLVKSDTWKNKLIFVLGVILAMQFHTAFIVYLIILIGAMKHKKFYAQIMFVFAIAIFVITFFNGRTVPLINNVYSLLLKEGDLRMYSYASGHLIFLYPTIVHVATTVLLIYSSDRVVFGSNGDGIKPKYVQLIKNTNIVFFIFVPFIIMNTTYYRLIRNAFFLNIIAEGIVFSLEKNKFRKLIIVISMLMISVLWLVFATRFYSSWEIIVDPVLKNGVLFWID